MNYCIECNLDFINNYGNCPQCGKRCEKDTSIEDTNGYYPLQPLVNLFKKDT